MRPNFPTRFNECGFADGVVDVGFLEAEHQDAPVDVDQAWRFSLLVIGLLLSPLR